MRVSEFFVRLKQETKQPTPPVPAESVNEWRKKLSALGLSGQQVQKLYDHVVDHNAWFPVWAEISEAIGELCLRHESRKPVRHWLLFDWYNKRFAIPVSDPSNAVAPEGAQNTRMVIDDDFQDHHEECITGEQARQYFTQGYNEAGGKPERLQEFFTSLTGNKKRALKP